MPKIAFALTCLLTMIAGCARYEYDIVRPANLARHIGKSTNEFELDGLQYRLQTVDNYLVMRIYNRSEKLVQLLAESYVIDPRGESHSIEPHAMPPESYVKLVFPPVRQQVVPTGPSIGIGIGASSSRRNPTRLGTLYEPPRYYTICDPEKYWQWKSGSNIQLGLVFKRESEQFEHEFTIRRRKM